MIGGSSISLSIWKSLAPCSQQITMPATHNSIFYRQDALPDAKPTVSKHRRQSKHRKSLMAVYYTDFFPDAVYLLLPVPRVAFVPCPWNAWLPGRQTCTAALSAPCRTAETEPSEWSSVYQSHIPDLDSNITAQDIPSRRWYSNDYCGITAVITTVIRRKFGGNTVLQRQMWYYCSNG